MKIKGESPKWYDAEYREKVSAKYKVSVRKHHLKKKYGVTLEWYKKTLADQGNCCAICKETNSGEKSLGVDHSHVDGTVRGLLCQRCNFGLGYFRDNIDLILKSADYLKKYECDKSF